MTTIDRLPPHSLEAEEAVLGSLLIDPDAIFDVATFLRPEAFYSAQNQTIYDAILSLTDRREPLDLITLSEELRRREQLEKVGGEATIISLINAVPTAINAVSYGRVVEAASLRRKLIGAASTIANLAYDEAEDVNIVIDRSEQALFSISEQRTTRDLVPVKQIAREYLERIEKLHERGEDIIGVPTGFTDLDRLLGGLNKSDLLILAARPGMGKCVTADTRLVDPQTGALTTIETLVQRQEANLLTLDHTYKLRPSQASHFIDNGIKPVYRVTTRQGREIKTTLSHPFLTVNGWQPLYNLAVGDRVATPRIIPVFGQNDAPDYEVKTLAYLLADGSLVGRTPQFTNSNPHLREDFTQAALHFPGNKARVDDSNGRRTPTVYISQDAAFFAPERAHFAQNLKTIMRQKEMSTTQLATEANVGYGTVTQWRSGIAIPTPANFDAICQVLAVNENELLPTGLAYSSQIKNTLTDWLEKVGVWGKAAAEKNVPAQVFGYTQPKLALFLNRLFACDGSIHVQGQSQPVVSYSTISKELAHSVQHLLLRFGILSKLRSRQMKYQGSYRPAYEIRVTDAASVLTFAAEIGALGKEESLARVKECCLNVGRNSNVDTIPVEVWQQIAQAKGEQSWATVYRQLGFSPSHNLHVGKRAPSRARLLALADVLQDEPLRHLAASDLFWDEIVSIEFVGEQQVYDLTVPGTHNFVADDMIVHNTALQTGIALTAATRYGKRVAMFNLEMSGEQLVQRMIATETRIDSQRLRRGQLQEQEWPIFMEAIGRLSETRIFIDDTPSITPNQLRTKCRRLYAEHGLDLIVIDYLQLMQAERSTNNRVQEISEISRSLKGLARELDVPVLAAAQLSRAVEQRSEKRPLLSDLRDSGCLTGDSLVTMADTGERVPIRNLVGHHSFRVLALNEDTLKVETAVASRAFSTGIKPVYELRTQLGRTIRATANHQFRTFAGWKRLDKLTTSDFLALPRNITIDTQPTMSHAELALLGHLIGDGCVLPRHAIQYTTRENDLAEEVAALSLAAFGEAIAPRIQRERTWYQVYLTSTRHHTHGVHNAVTDWFTELGIFCLRSYEKFVPEKVFTQPTESLAVFLRHLWATDGCIKVREVDGRVYPAVYYASSSPHLARDVQTLLLRLGINARLKCLPQKGKGRDQYQAIISGNADLRKFVAHIGAVGAYKLHSLQQLEQYLNQSVANTNRDIIPFTVWREYVTPAMSMIGMTGRQMQEAINQPYSGTSLYKQNVSRDRAARVAQAVQSEPLERLAQSDVYWDKIVSVNYVGEEEVYDLTVPGPHNFVANDIIAHNSIEQDADVVMFIYRDEYYNPDTTERPNIAEINIAKHRNGPIGSVDLYWHGKLATFRNLQRQEINL